MGQPTTLCNFHMVETEIVVLPDETSVAAEAAERLAIAVTKAVQQRGRATVALSGGSTPLAMFDLLAQPPYRDALPWPKIHIFWADERLVPPDDPGSNYYHAHNRLLSRVPLPAANIHRVHGEWPAEIAAVDYGEQLAHFAATHEPGSPIEWPRLDLVLLGLGKDGHTASLFPGSPVAAAGPIIVAHADYDGRPAERLSLTPVVINAAREIVFVVTGASKAEAIVASIEGERDRFRWPAQRIQPAEGTLIWLMDQAAAGQLR